MTEQQIIKTLATKVMGWRIDTPYWSKKTVWVKSSTQYDWIENWNPLENIADAWMIVEKFKNGDPILRAKFAVFLPVLIYEIEPKAICEAAMKVVEM
nr:hypothetical protein [Brevibacillus laterosporus]